MEGDNVSVNGRPPPPLASSGPHLDQQTTNYTIPGILHFIKHEWSRFEKERTNWEVERAELQVLNLLVRCRNHPILPKNFWSKP